MARTPTLGALLERYRITGHKDPRMLLRYTHLQAAELARKLG